MFLILILFFTAVPVFELYFLFKAGESWGILNTLSLVLITGVLGAYFSKREGRAILVRLQEKLNHGKLPADEVIHGALVFSGGLLLLTPGFITDIIGFSFIFPLTRFFVSSFLKYHLAKKIDNGSLKIYTGFSQKIRRDQDESIDSERKSSHDIKDVN